MSKYKMLTPGNKVTISLKTLYESKPNAPEVGIVGTDCDHGILKSNDGDRDYYDLDNGETAYACCDGETVTVVSEENKEVTFRNEDGEMPYDFKLSIAECETAIFGLK
jgi:hypothetical protein